MHRWPAAAVRAELHSHGRGAALLADSAHVAMAIILTGMLAEADNTGAAVQMIDAQTQSMLFFDQVHARNPSGIALNATAARVGADLAAQSYQQLAATHRAAGHEQDARRLLITQQRDLGARGQLGSVPTRLWHRTSGFAIGYGYRPTRALAGLLVVLLLAAALVLVAGGTREACALTPTTPAAQWYVVGGWVTTLLGWSVATLFVAGFTGLVRKT